MHLRNLRSAIHNPKFAVPLLLLILALLYKSPGLPPWGVASSNDQLLVLPPWQAVYPEVTSRITGGDPLLQQLPWRHWVQDEFAAGRFPLWASGPVGGAPLFAHYQTAALYPLNLLWSLIPIKVGVGIIEALKLWLIGLGMWIFLTAMGIRWPAALLSSIGLMFYSTFIVWLPWPNTNIFLLLPWLCWAVYAWCIQEKKSALIAFALLVLFAVLGGHPENLFITLLVTGIWALDLVAGSPPRLWPRQLAGLALAGITGLAMGAIQLLPFLEALSLSNIAADPNRGQTWRVYLDIPMAYNWILPRWWGQMTDDVLGGPNGFTESTSYLGLPALLGVVLAGLAAFRKQLNLRLALPWLVIGIFAWLLVYDATLGRFFRQLPLFDRSVNLRWVFIVGFAILVLSAFGWDWLIRERNAIHETKDRPQISRIKHQALLIGGIILLISGITIMVEHLADLFRTPVLDAMNGPFYAPTESYRWYWALWAIGVGAGTLGALLLWLSRWLGTRTAPVMSLVLGALLTTDLWVLTFTIYPASTPDKYYPTTSFISQAQALIPPTERVIVEGIVMPANTGFVYNIRDWRYQDPMISERAIKAAQLLAPGYDNEVWTAYTMYMPTVKMEVAPALGMHYVIYPAATNPATWEPFPGRPDFKRLAFKDGLGLYEMQGVPGFAYLSDHVEAVPGEPEAARWLETMTWAKIRTFPAVVEAPSTTISTIAADPGGSSPGSTTVTTYTPGHIVVQTDAQRPSLLVVAESYYPGWHATLDNQPTQILRANFLSQGIVVPAGTHTIELKYEPDSFRNGALLSLLGLVGLVALIVWSRRTPKAS